MKYIARPIEVEAFAIQGILAAVQTPRGGTGVELVLENGEHVRPTPEMTSRMMPRIGDYWVIQPDGYIYLNPKEVFEQKYAPKNAADIGASTSSPTTA